MSERNPRLHSPLCFPLHFIRRDAVPPGGGAKEAERGLCRRHLFSSGADVAPRRKSRKLFIPNHQLLLFSFQVSFISQLRDISFPLAEEVWGALPPLDTPQPCTLAPHANREVTSSCRSGGESWRLGAGGQQWGQCLSPPGATHY